MVALVEESPEIPYSSATTATPMRDVNARISERATAVLADPDKRALFLDIDGTLLGVAPTPDAVTVPGGLVDLLEGLMRGLDGAAAILTGRRVADADRLFAPLRMVASGVHGTELRIEPGGPTDTLAGPIPPELVQAINDVSSLHPGILVEQKGAGVAVHYRKAPEIRDVLEAELTAVISVSSYHLALRKGRKVLEAVPSGYSKGTAMRQLLARAPFKGRLPVMIGDDVGDESAFLVAEQLGGLGLRVAGEHYNPADADFDGVASVRAWLKTLNGRLAQRQHLPRNQTLHAG
jgi:trehalose 6-phosphate phosphatase